METPSVAIKNKLFVIGDWSKTTFEVYDCFCKTFVLVKSPLRCFERFLRHPVVAISIDSKIAVFGESKRNILFLLGNNEWSEESCEVTNNLSNVYCAKVPEV